MCISLIDTFVFTVTFENKENEFSNAATKTPVPQSNVYSE